MSTSEISLGQQVQIYPNPGKDLVRVTFDGDVQAFSVFDMNGKEVYLDMQGFSNEKEVDIQSFPSGLYILRLTTGEGYVIDKKLVKE